MNISTSMPRLKGFRFPREIIAYAVWAYHRFAISTSDVEDLLAERGVIVSREAIRLWINQFGAHFANCIRRDRPRPNDKWHLDEVVIPIRGKKHWLWRGMDSAISRKDPVPLPTVLPESRGPSVDFNIVFQPHRGMAPNLRVFVEFLKSKFRIYRPWEFDGDVQNVVPVRR